MLALRFASKAKALATAFAPLRLGGGFALPCPVEAFIGRDDERQRFFGPGKGDIGEAALFLRVGSLGRELSLLQSGDDHQRPFEPLGLVDAGQEDRVTAGTIALTGIAQLVHTIDESAYR